MKPKGAAGGRKKGKAKDCTQAKDNVEKLFPEIAALGPEDRIRTAEELECVARQIRAGVLLIRSRTTTPASEPEDASDILELTA